MDKVRTLLTTYKSHFLWGAAFVVGVLLLSLVPSNIIHQNVPVGEEATSTPEDVIPSGPVLAESEPVRLEIPKLGIDTTFTEPLGLDKETGEVVIPQDYERVGWYKHGPTPGEYGPSVILGHVDSASGPAIFFYLGQLSEGDDIYVTRADGTKAHFKVSLLERYEQVEFPTIKVYGDIDHAGLRLVTCSGKYDRASSRYSHNLVVYAKLVE